MSEKRTPYQGPGRVFGEFRCPNCSHTWSSGNSWANMGQRCNSCRCMVYPHTQRALRRPGTYVNDDDYDSRVPHLSHLCEKCRTLGYNCEEIKQFQLAVVDAAAPDKTKMTVVDTPKPTKITVVDTPKPTKITVVDTPTPATPEQQSFKTESMLLFEEAMKQGYVEVCIIKCLLLGAAGVGKTCLLRLLLDMLPPPLRQSTACIEQAIRAICVKYGIDSEGSWQKVDSDRLHDLLAGSVSCHLRVANAPADGASLSLNQQRVTTSTEPVSYTMGAIVKRLEEKPGLGKLQDLTWVYLVDSGGQPQFHELLTAFIRNASVGIIVHKLSERLDDHPLVKYFDKEGEQCGKSYSSPLSNRDIFQHCIQTVQSLPYTAEESACPQLAIVGTHRDEEHQCKGESRDEKNRQFLTILPPTISDNVFKRTRMQEVIYPVNAISPNPEDKEIANRLRKKIEELKPKAEKLPLKWYGLELELEKEAVESERWVFTKDECLQVAKRLHFPSDEALDAALMHLDKLNIFLYYPKVLPQLVFCSPCVLLDKLSELVEESHRLKHGHDPNALIEGRLSKFCKKGQVTAQLLKKYPKHYTEFFTQADLLKLFENLLIVAPISPDTYFMPSLLDVLKQSEFHRSSCGCPLIIYFKGGCAPLGLFSSLIAFLMSDKNEAKPWVIANEDPELYRNHITLALSPDPGSVTLIDSGAFFEVHVTISLPSLYKHTCRNVSQTVKRGLKEAIKARNFQNVDYQIAISCPCEEGTLHPALPNTSFPTPIWQCTQMSHVCGKLDEHHRAWVGNHTDTEPYGAESSPTEVGSPVTKCQKKETATEDTPLETVELDIDDSPTLPQLLNFKGRNKRKINISREIGTQYTTFGILLLVDRTGTRVAAIIDKHRGDAERINIEILREWLAGSGKPVSWRTLTGVLHEADLNVLADDIEAAF